MSILLPQRGCFDDALLITFASTLPIVMAASQRLYVWDLGLQTADKEELGPIGATTLNL